ncbi:MAG: hypothetical protein JWM34_1801 [Ilumatobacteraceae bacterium]|nr:hypothetical protein [Ilumatobacteraceae bacterium]
MAGDSETPLLQKLGIKEGTRMAVVNAPADFRENLGILPLAVEWANRVRPPLDLVVAFHTQRSVLMANWPALTAAAAPDGVVWVAWPKKASGVQTDISDTVLREELLRSGWVDNKVCAIDETWSALRFALRVERRPKRSAAAAKPAKLRKTRPGSHR